MVRQRSARLNPDQMASTPRGQASTGGQMKAIAPTARRTSAPTSMMPRSLDPRTRWLAIAAPTLLANLKAPAAARPEPAAGRPDALGNGGRCATRRPLGGLSWGRLLPTRRGFLLP